MGVQYFLAEPVAPEFDDPIPTAVTIQHCDQIIETAPNPRLPNASQSR